MREFLTGLGLGFLFMKPMPEKKVRTFTIQLTGLDRASKKWAADGWSQANGSTYLRVTFTDDFPNKGMALREAQRVLDRIKHEGKIYRFRVEESDPDDTPDCLQDDIIDLYPPQMLIERGDVRLLGEHEICIKAYLEGEYHE